MRDINKIILIGRLGADPVQRYTKTGIPVVNFSVATTRKFYRDEADTSGDPTPVEETQWHRVVVWGKQGQNCFQYLKKGNGVYLEGFLRTRKYEDKDGTVKYNTEVQGEVISFLGGRTTPTEEISNEVPQIPVELEIQ